MNLLLDAQQDYLKIAAAEIAVQRQQCAVLILGKSVGEAVSQVEWIAQACVRGDFGVTFGGRNQADRRRLDGVANLFASCGLAVLMAKSPEFACR